MDAHLQSFNDKTTVDYAASGSMIATVCGGLMISLLGEHPSLSSETGRRRSIRFYVCNWDLRSDTSLLSD